MKDFFQYLSEALKADKDGWVNIQLEGDLTPEEQKWVNYNPEWPEDEFADIKYQYFDDPIAKHVEAFIKHAPKIVFKSDSESEGKFMSILLFLHMKQLWNTLHSEECYRVLIGYCDDLLADKKLMNDEYRYRFMSGDKKEKTTRLENLKSAFKKSYDWRRDITKSSVGSQGNTLTVDNQSLSTIDYSKMKKVKEHVVTDTATIVVTTPEAIASMFGLDYDEVLSKLPVEGEHRNEHDQPIAHVLKTKSDGLLKIEQDGDEIEIELP